MSAQLDDIGTAATDSTFDWGSMLDALADFYSAHAKSVFFSVALTLLLEKLHLLNVLTKMSLTIVASLASQGESWQVPVSAGSPAVVVIGQADFHERYGEKSPMDHCLLADDLGHLLEKSPRVVGVDIDLSPLAHPSPSERACQARLDNLLDAHAAQLVLLAPFPTTAPSLQKAKHEWLLQRCAAGIAFADGTLETSMGLVTDYADGDKPPLRAGLAEQLHETRSAHICHSVATDTVGPIKRWLQPNESRFGKREGESLPINFLAARHELPVLDIGGDAFHSLGSLSGSAVLFGVDASDDDFLTPIGRKSGVVIHGAKLITFREPVRPWPRTGALADTVMALCFAWLVHGFWHRYVHYRRRDASVGKERRSGWSTAWMLGFIALFSLLVLYFILASQYLFSIGIAVAPLLIAVSMLVDGFIGGPIEQIQQLVANEKEHSRRWRSPRAASALKWLLLALAAVAMTLIGTGVLAPSTIAAAIFGLLVIIYTAATGAMLARPTVLKRFWMWLRADTTALATTVGLVFTPSVSAGERWGAATGAARALGFWAVIVGGVLILIQH